MFGNMKEMMGKLHEAQAQAKEMKERLEQIEVREESAGISIVLNANRVVKDVQISPDLLADAEELNDRLVLALNKALEKANAVHEKEMQGLAKGMLPGMDLFK